MDKENKFASKALELASKAIREKAQNNVNTLAAAEEILNVVSIEDIINEMENPYIRIDCEKIAKHLKECNYLTPAGNNCNWTSLQVRRIITRIYEKYKTTTL